MKVLVLIVVFVTMLCGCGTSKDTSSDPQSTHMHFTASTDNVIEHDVQGYCGNAVTTVRCYVPSGTNKDGWERSFWGSLSVSLTDFLRWLDYSEGICRCPPEYGIRTEFADSEYSVNLTAGYVRYKQGQVSLTDEQIEYLRQLLDDVAKGEEIIPIE